MAWAIQAPSWATPPHWLSEESYRLRSEAIEAWVRQYETNPFLEARKWQQLRRKGWRVVRVTVVRADRLPEMSILRVLVEQKHKAALADMNAAGAGTNTEAFAGGMVQAYSHVLTRILKAESRS